LCPQDTSSCSDVHCARRAVVSVFLPYSLSLRRQRTRRLHPYDKGKALDNVPIPNSVTKGFSSTKWHILAVAG